MRESSLRLSRDVQYKAGFKYQVCFDRFYRVEIKPDVNIYSKWIELTTEGVLYIRSGYAWDGASGPAFDTPIFMRASLIHDALYQLMREGHLPKVTREQADREMRRVCLEDGMWKWRAAWCYWGVRRGAVSAADPKSRKKVIVAP